MPYLFITQPVDIIRQPALAVSDQPVKSPRPMGEVTERLTNIRLVQRRPTGPFAKSADVVLREGVALDHNGVIEFKEAARKAFGLK